MSESMLFLFSPKVNLNRTIPADTSNSEDNLQLEIDEIYKSFGTNVIGVLNTVNSFLPLVRKGQLKKVVTISTAMGDLGNDRIYPPQTSYL